MSAADPGLFGPDSVTWRVHADRSMAVGGMRALLLQACHPVAMAGVAQFSDFRRDPWGRLFRTAEFVAVCTYGTTAAAEEAGARVRAVHARLRGSYDGRPFAVGDPNLVRWIHVAEAESFLTCYRRAGGHLAPGDADRYYGEMRAAARLVGVEDVPTSEADVADYFAAMRPQLRVESDARDAARFLLRPPMRRWVALATPARPAWVALGTLGFALLPRWARRLYALPGLPTTDLAASVAVRGLRAALAAVPPTYREGPAFKDAKARVGIA